MIHLDAHHAMEIDHGNVKISLSALERNKDATDGQIVMMDQTNMTVPQLVVES
jgi:hypothetical protein